ncbi:unnamed protein product [Zymoseptoria tritici ST99CH_1A5]|uniref:BHLH domain-containing protein n=2 Tax=Zymoseptoria tritici TaxID=1047171 RepID=A0A1X7RHC6_ZYMT9|nr:unnamed protein product [Zymoseptoria tritici ST99CH_3D7]SMR45335.1 unnamed protein product [Zymoseptoria tritici ST99CH_3D1]SMY20494.1 unnamed protein product [Zymoseptoria tritici ST99CH_1A5]
MSDDRGMPVASTDNLTVFPPFQHHKRDSPLDLGLDDDDMAFIKNEELNDFNSFNPNDYTPFQGSHNGNMNINPANLTNGNSNNGYMSSSFNLGNSGIADDELLDLQIDQQSNAFDFNNGMQQGFMNQQQMAQQSGSMFSHTPDGAPMHSPFTGEFNYGNFRSAPGQQQFGAHSMPQQQSAFRPGLKHGERKVSDSRSPGTPSINHLQITDDYNHPGMQPIQHRQQNSMGAGWDSTPDGAHSWGEASPFPSPSNGQPIHPQISEVLKNSSHHHKVASSLPTKMENGAGPPFSTQEAKRRRRRESHNMVERRRRDNINERIHDLGTLVPQHRLEDEKVRKHLQTNAPLSPSITHATGMSPPNSANTVLGGGQSRRTGSGTITQGLPMEEKDKGPNKGDILNGSVAWTRDMMWFMHMKLRQEEESKELIQRLGGTWPFEVSEEEHRMRSEILEVLNKHAPVGGFSGYSRAAGSGLRVPGFTNVAGDTINEGPQSSNGLSIPPISPGFQSGGSGMNSGMSQHFWGGGDLKEEDEYELM